MPNIHPYKKSEFLSQIKEIVICAITICSLFSNKIIAQSNHTKEDRKALFDYIVDKTIEREAFSPIKNETLELDFKKQAPELEKEFIKASSDIELYRALVKLSNLRKDRHLDVRPLEDGLNVVDSYSYAPIKFAPDFSCLDTLVFFVSELAINYDFTNYRTLPQIGDIIISINDFPIKKYFQLMEPHLRYSTFNGLKWSFATSLTQKRSILDKSLYHDQLKLELLSNNGKKYSIELPYYNYNVNEWKKREIKGFKKIFDTRTYALYLPEDNKKVILLDWHRFSWSILEDIDSLMNFSINNTLLDQNVIVDATHSGGGSNGAVIISKIVTKPFKTTFGNVKCCDVTPLFPEEFGYKNRTEEWLYNDVIIECAEGKEYANSVPFKLAHLPKESDGILQPSKIHFTGKLVCLFSSTGGSHLDQFAAMIIDNELGYTIGMPTGGYSNTWEWEEDLVFPTTNKKVANYMWSIGHTIRPNGEILEGNPAIPEKEVLLSRENFRTYYNDLIDMAIDYLSEQTE